MAWTEKLERFLELGGIRKDIVLLVLSGAAVGGSLLGVQPLPFDLAWVAVILCGVPIVLEAVIGLVTAFDIKADVLVSLALIASLCIGETFAAGEVAFIMQLGALLEELTVAKARAASKSWSISRPRRPGSSGMGGRPSSPPRRSGWEISSGSSLGRPYPWMELSPPGGLPSIRR